MPLAVSGFFEAPVGTDFSNPYLAAAIVLGSGERFPLWSGKDLNSLNTTGKRDANGGQYVGYGPPEALSYLSDVTIELQLNSVPVIKAVLRPPFREGLRLLNSELVLFGRNQLEVVVGYASGRSDLANGALLSPIFKGLLLRPDIQIGSETVITLNAQGLGGFGAKRQTTERTFNEETINTVIYELLTVAHGIKIDDSFANDDAQSHDVKKAYLFGTVTRAQGHKSDWQFAYEIAQDIGLYLSQVEDRTVKLIPRSSVYLAQSHFELTAFDIPQGALFGNQYPILTATSDSDVPYFPGVRSILLKDIESKTRGSFEKEIGDALARPARSDDLIAGGGSDTKNATNYAPSDKSTGANFEHLYGQSEDDALIRTAQSYFSGAQSLIGVPLDVETFGIPEIRPGDTVDITGLGLLYDGHYGVWSVIHMAGSNGFTTKLSLRMNMSKFIHPEDAVKPLGTPNTNTVVGNLAHSLKSVETERVP